jgi:uncharacterized protein (UPF0332 family)
MDPTEFIDAASEFLSSDREAYLRSAVSRAYYGAFHVVRALVVDLGVQVPRHDVHDKLRWCLKESHEPIAQEVARRLNSLRVERNKADYDLAAATFRLVSP